MPPMVEGEGLAGKLIEVGPTEHSFLGKGCLSGSKTENVYCIAMNIFVYLCLCMMQLYVLYLSRLDR